MNKKPYVILNRVKDLQLNDALGRCYKLKTLSPIAVDDKLRSDFPQDDKLR